jgi:hypothetical protein
MAISGTEAETANWVASGIAIVILLVRTIISRKAEHVTLASKVICVASILIVSARIPVVYYMLKLVAEEKETGPSQSQASLVLIARCLATTFFWLQTTLLVRFYARVVQHIQWARRTITAIWVCVVITYIACIVVIFAECRPLHLYWANPAPECTRAYAQIFLQAACTIFLDVLLLVIAYPIAARRNLKRTQKIQVAILMALGTFCIVVTGLKLAFVVGEQSNQPARTLWASVQVVVSTYVANAPTIYGCIMLKYQEKKRSSLPAYNIQTKPKRQTKDNESEVELREVECTSCGS